MTASHPLRHAPVVVVGAGPVGLTTALGFAALGVDTLVLESGPIEVSPEWRGSTIHPPTLQILDHLGLANAALVGGVRVDTIQYRDLVLEDVVEMSYSVLADHTRFPFRLQYDQYKLLRAMRQAASSDSHIDVRYGHRVVGVEPGSEGRPATLRTQTSDGEVGEVGATWVVAADGSHSVIRGALGIAMRGCTYPTSSLVVATDYAFGAALRGLAPVSYWTGPDGRMSLIRTPETWRVAITTVDPSVQAGSETEFPQTDLHPQFVAAMAHAVGERAWVDLRQHQLYRSHQRVAETFCVNRVVLVGDAAHLSATTGGMGLNSGVHDAFELVHALAPTILRGGGWDATAEEVASRRRRVALELVQPRTTSTREELDRRDIARRRERLESLRRIANDPALMTEHLARASMLDAVDLGPARVAAWPSAQSGGVHR